MRLVIDTNVVISALLWRGTPYWLLDAIRHQEQVRLFTSIVLLEELAEVLTRPTPAKRLALIGRNALQVYQEIRVINPAEALAIVASRGE